MKKYLIIAVLMVAAIGIGVFWRRARQPQEPSKVWRIGILQRGVSYDPGIAGYKERMAELGYREGQNVVYDFRLVQTKEEMTKAAEELVATGSDLMLTWSTPATQAAYAATKDLAVPIPIVFGSMGDPLATGLVKSIQRPGTNVTGVASLSTELTEKRIELLKKVNPMIQRIAMPHTERAAGDVAANKSVDIAQEAAKKFGVTLLLYPLKSNQEYARVAQTLTAEGAEGIIVGGDSLVWGGIDTFAKHAIAKKLPLAAFDLSHIQKGALIGFGPDYRVTGAQAAGLTHQILRGGDPAQISVEVPQKLMLIVNLDTARSIGITLSEELLQQADVVVGSR